jgi:hypothetical protein
MTSTRTENQERFRADRELYDRHYEANEMMAKLHDRMPVILQEQHSYYTGDCGSWARCALPHYALARPLRRARRQISGYCGHLIDR